MPTLRDALRRWRPAAALRATSRAAVPHDPSAEPERELAAVFRTLEPVQAQCRGIRKAAELDALQVKARARKGAEAIVADARTAASAERAGAAAASEARGAAERAGIVDEAERTAERIRAHGAAHMASAVAEAVELVDREVRDTGRARAGPAGKPERS